MGYKLQKEALHFLVKFKRTDRNCTVHRRCNLKEKLLKWPELKECSDYVCLVKHIF